MKHTRRQVVLAAAMLAAAQMPGAALAQSWPGKPITIVVAYPAGGDTDVLARLYAKKLSERLKQPVIVDNRVGASGTIGSSFVARAEPDGYTLLMAPNTFAMAQFVLKVGSGSSYDVLGGFTPIVQTGVQPLFLATSESSGIKDIKTLIEQGKRGGLSFASPGSGSPMHIVGELFNKVTGVKLEHIPYKGVAPAMTDLIGGQVASAFMTWGPLAPYVADRRVTVLATTSASRSTLAPDVPTLDELGVKGVEISAWQGLFGPKGLPPEVVKLLNEQLNEILKMPDVITQMATFGALPAGGAPERLARTNAADYERFGKLVKELGIQPD